MADKSFRADCSVAGCRCLVITYPEGMLPPGRHTRIRLSQAGMRIASKAGWAFDSEGRALCPSHAGAVTQ